jgi:LPS-assembly protein
MDIKAYLRGSGNEQKKSPESSMIAQNKRQRMQYTALTLFFIIFHFSICSLFSPSYSFAEETETVITSDSLEYFSETKMYVAKGAVQIVQKDAVITADEITYDENTSDIIANGSVFYHDTDTSLEAQKAELNFERKTGKLFDADIFSAKDNYHLSGKEIEKRGENSYYSPSAAFTTCDAPIPAWCFRGKNIDVVTGERLLAQDASFRIKNVPVLYTPYLWVPILTSRQTGLLMPAISQSQSRGFGLNIPFFWAISQNRDFTFELDTYSKRGIGAGMEYRFIEPGGINGYGWAYYIRDNKLKKNFFEIKGLYENRSATGTGGFLNINLLNEKDYYRAFSTQLQTRTQRFLESTGELNLPLKNSRLYLLGQYWIDLKHDIDNVPQKLPEAGYVLNYTKLGSSLISASLTGANIWRDGGLSARRIDLYPKLLHSFGNDFVLSQKAAVRATSYSYYQDDKTDKDLFRTALEYDVVGHTRLHRKYNQFLHVIEPSVRYHFISSSDNNLPVLDASELFGKTSVFELSLLNRLIISGAEVVTARITQEIDTYNGDRPFLPLGLALAMNRWVPIKLDAKYNIYTGMIETLNSELGLTVLKANLAFGQTYNRIEDVMLFRAGLAFSPYKNVSFGGSIWYDAKGGGVRDMNIIMRYLRQCWGLRFEVNKKPGDYTVLMMFELAGFTGEPSKR